MHSMKKCVSIWSFETCLIRINCHFAAALWPLGIGHAQLNRPAASGGCTLRPGGKLAMYPGTLCVVKPVCGLWSYIRVLRPPPPQPPSSSSLLLLILFRLLLLFLLLYSSNSSTFSFSSTSSSSSTHALAQLFHT